MAADQIVITYTAEDAARAVLDRLGPGDVVLVKGSLATRMEQVTRALLEDRAAAADVLVRQDAAWQHIVTVRPDRPTWLEIDLGAIAHNVRRLKQLAGDAQLMISLKADAYGHGAIQVAQTALLNGATWLGVACLSEGRRATPSGHRRPDPDPGLHAGLAGARRLAPRPDRDRLRPGGGAGASRGPPSRWTGRRASTSRSTRAWAAWASSPRRRWLSSRR